MKHVVFIFEQEAGIFVVIPRFSDVVTSKEA